MRIIQLIDSLEIGGAERMAVNYANALLTKVDFSGLIATRNEGNLKNQLNNDVHYLFLDRKRTIDFNALIRLKNYCKLNKIDIIQAHSSSIFTASLVKMIYPRVKIIWHDHYGGIVSKRDDVIYIQVFSFFFSGIIAVNQELKKWAIHKLFCKKNIYFSNFTSQSLGYKKDTILKGVEGKRILCLANLRIQKNHLMLVEVTIKLKNSHPDWSFHFVGKDFEDGCSEKLKNAIFENNLQNFIHLYNSRQDIENIINQSDIAVFSSISEGLPVSLLEFGICKKAVLSTNVGEIPLIIEDKKNGLTVPSNDVDRFYEKLVILIENEELRNDFGASLFETISKKHSQDIVIENYLTWIKTI